MESQPDERSTLLHNRWFGKAVGGVLALAFTPPDWLVTVAAVSTAVAAGHAYDVWSSRGALHGQSALGGRSERAARELSLRFQFSALGRLARASGVVRPEHIELAETLLRDQGWTGAQRQQAIGWFTEGRDHEAPLESLAERSVPLWRARPDVRDSVHDALCRGLLIHRTLPGEATLITLGMLMDVSPTALHQRLALLQTQPARTRADDYRTLDLSPDASAEAVAQAYRRLVARYHPDRLGKHATQEERAYHERRMREIRQAYEALREPG
jgi:DnaJ like chaperone protein